MNSHKSAFREAMFGHWIEAEAITRPLFEALIYLAEAAKNPEFDDRYSRSQEIVRRKLIVKTLEDMKSANPVTLPGFFGRF